MHTLSTPSVRTTPPTKLETLTARELAANIEALIPMPIYPDQGLYGNHRLAIVNEAGWIESFCAHCETRKVYWSRDLCATAYDPEERLADVSRGAHIGSGYVLCPGCNDMLATAQRDAENARLNAMLDRIYGDN